MSSFTRGKQVPLPVSSRDNWCRHRTAYTKDFPTCKAGVDFHQFEKVGGPYDMPCSGEPNHESAAVACPKFSPYTVEENAARHAEIELSINRIGVIRGAIIANIKATGVRQGTIPCPACKTGTVGYSQASNGHVHARCSTKGCASWME